MIKSPNLAIAYGSKAFFDTMIYSELYLLYFATPKSSKFAMKVLSASVFDTKT